MAALVLTAFGTSAVAERIIAGSSVVVDSVRASGPEAGETLEDRVEVFWSTENAVASTSRFEITRDGSLLAVLASTESIYEDFTVVPGETFEYCVSVREADGSLTAIGCDDGARRVARPTGFTASDGLFEDRVQLGWSDRSEIEAGYVIYRDVGNALDFDGSDDFVATEEVIDLIGSFTFEFWARRASTGTDDFIINLETEPNGDPTDVDIEMGFSAADRFQVRFGTNVLETDEVFTDDGWHHWAVVYDAPNARRFIYRDGERVTFDDMSLSADPTGDLEFGRRTKNGNRASRGHFHGQLDEVRWWSDALTQDEVQRRMMELLNASVPDLAGYWPMDVASGLVAPDVVGDLSGTLTNMSPDDWVPTGASDHYVQIGADITGYVDDVAITGFQFYDYRIAAFEDRDGDGVFDPGPDGDYTSEERSDDGWRAFLTPPAAVTATDGQFNDRIRVEWVDQSAFEEGYVVYREGSQIASLAIDATSYEDLDATGTHTYCVAAVTDGIESVQRCDVGVVGDLPEPVDVAASDSTFDDRIVITWQDTTDTEDGFLLFRDGELLVELEADAEEYNDFSARQDVIYDYCVQAFSEADELDPALSDQVCDTGYRAVILEPAELAVTDREYEDRVELSWQNPSTTAMLYLVYREGVLIEVLDFNVPRATDRDILSDSDVEYCVTSATVVETVDAAVVQSEIAQVLETMRHEDAVGAELGEAPSTVEQKLEAVYELVGVSPMVSGAMLDTTGFYESGSICATGARLLAAPTEVDATDDEFESHVQLEWTDNSSVETGYFIYRAEVGDPMVRIDSLSRNRTTYGDYSGTPGVQYTYTVAAYDGIDSSHVGSDNGIRTLEPPTNLRATDGVSETVVQLLWEDNSAAEVGYRIYRSIAGADAFSVVDTTGANDVGYVDAIPDNLLGATFDYRVVAYDAFGESDEATDQGNTFVEAPANVNASDVYVSEVVVVWVDRSEIEESYVLTRRELGTSAVSTFNLSANQTEYTDVPPNGAEYEYCVSAVVVSNGSPLQSPVTCDVGSLFDPSGGGPPATGVDAVRMGRSFLSSSFDRAPRVGTSVAVSADAVFVGSPGLDALYSESRGAVTGFILTPDNIGDVLYGDFALFDPDGRQQEYGAALDASGDYVVVGDPYLEPTTGKFEVWKKSGSWSDISADDQLIDRSEDGNLGVAAAILDSFAVVGNDVLDNRGTPEFGGAIVCNAEAAVRNDTTCGRDEGVLALDSLLTDAQLVPNAGFGSAVDITRIGDSLHVIVGAPGNDQAFIFACNTATTSCDSTQHWSTPVELFSDFRPNEEFGAAVAISPRLAVVGVPGSGGEGIQIFERTPEGIWETLQPFSPLSDAGEFGSAVALLDSIIIVGAPGEDISDYEDAGAVYVMSWDSSAQVLSAPVRYDGRVAGPNGAASRGISEQARFGASVDLTDEVGPGFYVVGAPGATWDPTEVYRYSPGLAYSIPFGFEPPDDLIVPPGVDLALPSGIRASDGTAPDRIQIRWDDESDDEDGHIIYRSDATGELERLAEVSANVEFFDDFEAAPGGAYTYCVTAFFAETETEQQCDIGWRPPNGTIAGRLATSNDGGTEGAQVCLDPNPNRALLFDGAGGYVEAQLSEELDLFRNFTMEAWILPHATDGVRYVASKDSSFALAVRNDSLAFVLFRDNRDDEVFEATGLPLLQSGRWQHVAASMDDERRVRLYVDGVAADGLYNGSNQASAPASLAGDTLSIAQRGDTTGFFGGEIDEVRIWNGVRSDSLIAATRFDALVGEEEELIGYWPLDQGERRVVPDVTESANHGNLFDGTYLADDGAPLEICAVTDEEGNYSIASIRYGESTEFKVIPDRPGRRFSPAFASITLTVESPVDNLVFFNDVTAYTLAGTVQYVDEIQTTTGLETLSCPVPDVRMHASKGAPATDENVRVTTGDDGAFAIALDPSIDPGDTWRIIPTFTSKDDDEIVHSFTPEFAEFFVDRDSLGIIFEDDQRFTLSGNFSGGDPGTCGLDIGVATVRIYTQDGCYDRTFTVDSGDLNDGAFSLDLPPLEYLVDVVSIDDIPAGRDAEEIRRFFEELGTVEVDLTQGDAERNLIYRAPITLQIAGLDAPSCSADQIVQLDEEKNTLRVLPAVPTIGEFQGRTLTFSVNENYGGGEACAVGEGEITVFDGIADRADEDSTLALGEDGSVQYTTFGTSPNIFSGARIGGVDRSFQKPITVVAEVEGRDPIVETRWALVEGFRERAATFVSATTEEFPLLIVHDPPGSNSNAFLEKGTTFCNRLSNMKMLGGGAGLDVDLKFGFKTSFITAPIGVGVSVKGGAGFAVGGRVVAGQDVTQLQSGMPNREICVTTTEAVTTSTDPGWVGEDIHVGAALNLIFALADVLEFEESGGTCSVELSETLASDLDEAEPFETAYVYGKSHIALSLIPELENLIRIAGDETIEGDIDGEETKIRLQSAVDNWKAQLANSEDLQEEALANPDVNRSFSGGTQFAASETADTTTVTSFESTRIYLNADGHVGGVTNLLDFNQNIYAVFEVRSEWLSEEEATEGSSQTIGYVLQDEDTGDYLSVDVAKNSRYGTFVFGTQSGRTSNPCEANTQCRDNPIIAVDPPIIFNVNPNDAATFDVTLINGSESDEKRRYMLAAPAETNPGGLAIDVAGGRLGGSKPYLLEPGKALTVKMDVRSSPSQFSYEDVALVLYPEGEHAIWTGDVRQPFALSDTAFFNIHYDSTGGNLLASMMDEGWNWISINREGGSIETVFDGIPVSHGDRLLGTNRQARFDSTAGWQGDLLDLAPGEGYRLWLNRPAVLRVAGAPVHDPAPLALEKKWNWIGYLPDRRMTVDEALASFSKKAAEGDAVVGQQAFAQFVPGRGWVGTLDHMEQGESYALFSSQGGELVYADAPESPTVRTPVIRETTVRGPEWKVQPERYDAFMTAVAEIDLDGLPIDHTAFKVAALDGEVVRGLGEVHYVEELEAYRMFMLVYGHADEELPLRIHVYDGGSDALYEDVATMSYVSMDRVGSPAHPVTIELANAGKAPQLSDIPEQIALHPNFPNPVQGYTTIGYDLPKDEQVRIVVYDILGRQVIRLVDEMRPAGRHSVVFDASRIASGMYVYRMEVGSSHYTDKMIVVR